MGCPGLWPSGSLLSIVDHSLRQSEPGHLSLRTSAFYLTPNINFSYSEVRWLRVMDESWKYLGTSDSAGVVVRASRAKQVIRRIVNV